MCNIDKNFNIKIYCKVKKRQIETKNNYVGFLFIF